MSTFTSLLERDENLIPGVPQAPELLWRLLRAMAAFPFEADGASDSLDCNSYLTAFTVLRSGRSTLHVPGYRVRQPGEVGWVYRQKEPSEWTSLVFESLATEPGTDELCAAAASSIHESADLVDVMAACMWVEEDKQPWWANDFGPAVSQLPEARLKRRLRWPIKRSDFSLLMRLALLVRNARGNDTDEPKSVDSLSGDDETVRALLGTVVEARVEAVSWEFFSGVVEEHVVHISSQHRCGEY